MKRFKFSFIALAALVMAMWLSPFATPSAAQTTYQEAPILAEQVKAGKLPAVADRLPKTPSVVKPFNETGNYGGELRFGFTGGSAAWGGLLYIAGWENLTRWNADFTGVVPNILESLTPNDDASVWTAKVREGMKWSDGKPFTADDIAFYIEDVLMDKEISATGFGADWCPADMAKEFKFEKVDASTVKFIFPKSYGTFPLILAEWQGRQFAMYPKHYLQQYHKKYNPDIDALVKKEGAENWFGLFLKKAPANWGDPDVAFFMNPDFPTIGPWRVTQPLGAGTSIILERNAYYWKVDDKGNQLPYVDKVVGTMFQDDQARTLAMLNGDIDFLKDPANDTRPQFVEASDKGKIFINNVLPDAANGYVLQFNMTHATKGEVFADKNFRIGVSYAINRKEMIELFNQGLGTPSQVCPMPESPLYNEKCNSQHIAYDVAKANEYLDKVLPKKDGDGMRLGADGKPFTIILFVINNWTWAPNNTQIGEKTMEYLKAVGLTVQLNALPSEQWDPVWKSNQVEAFLSTGEGGAGVTALLDPRNFVPMEQFSHYGNAWSLWRLKSTGMAGISNEIEPPQWVKDVRQAYNDAISQPTSAGQIEKMKKVVEQATDQFYQIGGWQGGDGWYPWSVRMGNIPEKWFAGWIPGVFKIIAPEQWYIKS
jgi:peptide/nickel transport system substrate-binding protein